MSQRRTAQVKATFEALSRALGSTVVEAAGQGLIRLLGIAEEVAGCEEEYTRLCDSCSRIGEILTRAVSPALGDEISPVALASAERVAKQVQKIVEQSEQVKKRTRWGLGQKEEAAALLQRMNVRLNEILVGFPVELGISAQAALQSIDANVRNLKEVARAEKVQHSDPSNLIASLPTVPHARYNSKYNSVRSCLEGTRETVTHGITQWIDDLSPGAPTIFWLCGAAGTGKSTIALTIAEREGARGNLAATFFFSRSEAERSDVLLLFPDLASQMTRFRPLKPQYPLELVRTLSRVPDAAQQSLKEQIQNLFVGPLAKAAPDRPAVIVIDALDECVSTVHVEEMLLLLSERVSDLPRAIKILISSRPAIQISSRLNGMVSDLSCSRLVLHDIEETLVREDILLYLRHHLTHLDWQGQMERIWTSETDLQRLADKAGLLFIFAATAVTFIKTGPNPRERFNLLLRDRPREKPRQNEILDALYTQVLCESLRGLEDGDVDRELRLVLGAIVLLRDALPLEALAKLLHVHHGIAITIVGRLQSLLLIPQSSEAPVRVLHPSFPEFLNDPRRCLDTRFYISAPEHHYQIALHALLCLVNGLKHDICHIGARSMLNSEVEGLEDRVAEHITGELRYSCLFWVYHLIQYVPEDGQTEYLPLLRRFCQTKLLCWLEVLSLLGSLTAAVESLPQLLSWFTKLDFDDDLVETVIQDCERFVLEYFVPISASSTQIYDSALAFAPDCTLRSIYFSGLPSETSVRLIQTRAWGDCVHFFEPEDHEGEIDDACFSSDGSRIACSDVFGDIRVWDRRDGRLLQVLKYEERHGAKRTFETSSHSGEADAPPYRRVISSLALAPDGNSLACCFGSPHSNKLSFNRVCIWNLSTSRLQREIFLVISRTAAESLSFSPDSSMLAIGHASGIQLVDVRGLQPVRCFDDPISVLAVEFSPIAWRGCVQLAYAAIVKSATMIGIITLDEPPTVRTLHEVSETEYLDLKFAAQGTTILLTTLATALPTDPRFPCLSWCKLLDASNGQVLVRWDGKTFRKEYPLSSRRRAMRLSAQVYETGLRAWSGPGDLLPKFVWPAIDPYLDFLALSGDGKAYLAKSYDWLLLKHARTAHERTSSRQQKPSSTKSGKKWIGKIAKIFSRPPVATSAIDSVGFETRRLLQKGDGIVKVSSSPNGAFCAMVIEEYSSNTFEVWDEKTCRIRHTYPSADMNVTFGPDNHHFVLWYWLLDGIPLRRFELWNIKSNLCLYRTGDGFENVGMVRSLVALFPPDWSPGSAVLFVPKEGKSRRVICWNPWAPSLKELDLNPVPEPAYDQAWFPFRDSRQLTTLSSADVARYRLKGSTYELAERGSSGADIMTALAEEANVYIHDGWLFCRRPDRTWGRLCWIPIELRPNFFARADEHYTCLSWRRRLVPSQVKSEGRWVVLDISKTWAARMVEDTAGLLSLA